MSYQIPLVTDIYVFPWTELVQYIVETEIYDSFGLVNNLEFIAKRRNKHDKNNNYSTLCQQIC